jgi:hypothetical protein
MRGCSTGARLGWRVGQGRHEQRNVGVKEGGALDEPIHGGFHVSGAGFAGFAPRQVLQFPAFPVRELAERTREARPIGRGHQPEQRDHIDEQDLELRLRERADCYRGVVCLAGKVPVDGVDPPAQAWDVMRVLGVGPGLRADGARRAADGYDDERGGVHQAGHETATALEAAMQRKTRPSLRSTKRILLRRHFSVTEEPRYGC